MGFAARIALLCALLPATLGAAGADDLGRFLDRMRAAAGGPVWSTHIVSIVRLTLRGTQTIVSSDAEGLRFRLMRCTGELCEGSYFDGLRLFGVNINETALPDSRHTEPYLRSLRRIASLGFLGPDFPAGGRRIEDGGVQTLAGERYHKLLLVDPEAIPMELFVDPATALLRYARDVNGDDTFEYRDYRQTAGGFMLPFNVALNGNVLEHYDDRTPVASAFYPPRGFVPAFAGAPERVATDPDHTTPIFACTIASIPARCLLDSGNSGLSISNELAARLNAPAVGAFQVSGLGGYSAPVVRGGSLQIGNATFPPAYYVVLNDIRTYGYDVVVGADVLAATNVELDSAAHALTLGASLPNASMAVPLAFTNFIPVVDVALGSLDTQLAVDTGDESNINLGFEFYSAHPDLFPVTGRQLVAGVGGSSVELTGLIPQVTIGDYRTGPQAIGTTQTLHGTAHGHLGAAFLAHFTVFFDYAAGELHLVPAP
jgi:Aspartyl protease